MTSIFTFELCKGFIEMNNIHGDVFKVDDVSQKFPCGREYFLHF